MGRLFMSDTRKVVDETKMGGAPIAVLARFVDWVVMYGPDHP